MADPALNLSRGFTAFKRVVFGLLALDVALFFLQGTATEAADTAAWLVLLALFELETAHPELVAGRLRLVHALRLAAAAVVLWAAAAYLLEREWLDALNAWTWLGVVALLEWEVRRAARGLAPGRLLLAALALLYGVLIALALGWALQREWLDFFDAVLWLLAFFAIELNFFSRRGGPAQGARAAPQP